MSVLRLPQPEANRASLLFDRIVQRPDPFAFVPAPMVAARIVSIGPYYLRPTEYAALQRVVPGSTILIANLGLDGSLFAENVWRTQIWRYPFDELKSDESWNGIGSSAVWGADGAWAIVTSDEGHGVAAGSAAFVAEFTRELSWKSEELADIVERICGGFIGSDPQADRVRSMVERIYSEGEARRIFDGP